MRDRHAHTVGGRSPEPAPIFPSRPRSPIGKPVNDPRGKSRTHGAAGSIARLDVLRTLMCQPASKFDPSSASNFDPFVRRGLAVALGSSELAGIAEARRARVM